jgi:hypothetical protein
MTQDWPTLLVLCRDYFNSVKPQGILRKDSSADSTFDRIAHQKKVEEWFLNPSKFRREIENEQRKHSGKCIYHLSKSHPTADCNVKKECDIMLADRKNNSSSTQNASSSGQLRNLKEEIFEDAISEDVPVDLIDDSTNDTNEDELIYFAHVTNHYL